MSPRRPLGAQMSHALKDRGVDVIFGIPGVHNVELYRGIEQAGITHVLARHEQGAGFMADGYARATGKPGVAFVISGPGLCFIMTPMGQAYSDSVPMLVISSCLEREHLGMGRGRLHEMLDQEAAAATVCDWSRTAPDAGAAFDLIDKAMVEFVVDRPRSKHIQVPIDVLASASDQAPAPRRSPERKIAPRSAIAEVKALLSTAKRPLFIFGGGAACGFEAARGLVEQTGAVSFSTYAGRGIIAPEQGLHFGATLPRAGATKLVSSADLVIAIGTQLAEVDLWRDKLGHAAPMVRVDVDASVISDWHHAEYPVLGDAPTFMAELLVALEGEALADGWKDIDANAIRRQSKIEVNTERPGIVPIVEAVQAALPKDTLIYSDMTQFAYVAKEVYELSTPNLWHHPTGFGTLGYALPAAIGGKVGQPNQPVIAIIGDYGFHYTMQELGVAVELGQNLPIILWDNGKLKEIEQSMINAQIEPNAVTARNPDFCKLADAFGAYTAKPATLDDLQAALLSALAADAPTLILVTPDIL